MNAVDFSARGLVRKLDADLASDEPGKGASRIGAPGGGAVQDRLDGYATRVALKTLTPSAAGRVSLKEPGRFGEFTFDPANHSANVSADPQEGIFIAPASDASGASGAWVRQWSGKVKAEWFGWSPAATGAQNKLALQAAIDLVEELLVYGPQGSQIVDLGHGTFDLGAPGDTIGVTRIKAHIEGCGPFATQIVWRGDLDSTVVRWDSHARGGWTRCRFRNGNSAMRPKHWIDLTYDSGHGLPRLTDWGDSFNNFYEAVSGHADAAALKFGSIVNYSDSGLRFQGGTRHIHIVQSSAGSNRRGFHLSNYTYDYSDGGPGEFSEHILVDITGSGSLVLDLAPTRCEGSLDMIASNPAFVRVTDTQGPNAIGAEAVTLILHGSGIQHGGANACWLVYQDTTQTGSGAPHTNIFLPAGITLSNFQGLQGGNWNSTHKGLEPAVAASMNLPPYSNARTTAGMFTYLGRNPRFRGTIQGDNGVQFIVGSGNPEGGVIAAKGSLFLRTDGGAGFSFYVKTGGTEGSPTNTGWFNASIQRSGSTISSPNADATSLKGAVDAIRAALSASGVTN